MSVEFEQKMTTFGLLWDAGVSLFALFVHVSEGAFIVIFPIYVLVKIKYVSQSAVMG